MTHLDLHRTLRVGSGNQMLMRIWPLVESQIRMAMSLDQATRSDLARDGDLYIRLVDVIASGDEAAIVAEVRDHIAHSAAEVRDPIAHSADEVVKLIEAGKTSISRLTSSRHADGSPATQHDSDTTSDPLVNIRDQTLGTAARGRPPRPEAGAP